MLASSKLLGIKDASDLTGLSKQYIHQLCDEGKLRFENTSSGKIFLEEDILKFQKERKDKAKNDPRIKL